MRLDQIASLLSASVTQAQGQSSSQPSESIPAAFPSQLPSLFPSHTPQAATTPANSSPESASASFSGGKLKTRTRTIVLGNETCLEFTEQDVGPPPVISFANDLPRLNRMWDDTSANWDGHSVLVIKGIPIPIIYWKEVYARTKSGGSWKSGHWKRVKGSWCEWKVSVVYNSLNNC